MNIKRTDIAIGIIINAANAVFVMRRKAESHLAGFWEFPGGKVEMERDETVEQALYRELKEETGIVALNAFLLKTLEYDYPDRQLKLHFYIIDRWQGEPTGLEEQQSRWLDIASLVDVEFPPANQPIIAALKQRYLA